MDFGSVEVQAVYISGNVRKPFTYFMEDPKNRTAFDWSDRRDYPRADYLSSSRKRLVPQLIFKGGILNEWRKKQAVVVHSSFFDTLPDLPVVSPKMASMAWLIYDLSFDETRNRFDLKKNRTVYTDFEPALKKVTNSETGQLDDFIELLQARLDEKLEENNPPDAPALNDLTSS